MVDFQQKRCPAKLFGEGFSEEAQKITTLTKYLELETWTPLLASLLVSGIQPPPDCTEVPNGAMGLDNAFIVGSKDPFHQAKNVLLIWNSREIAPLKIRPADFVAWCKTKKINTDWLSEVELAGNAQATNSAKVEAVEVEIESSYVPRNAVGKLAVKAAIQIEKEGEGRATAKQVIDLLKKWAVDGDESDLRGINDLNKNVVVWITSKRAIKDYTTQACEKTLEKWNKGRQ